MSNDNKGTKGAKSRRAIGDYCTSFYSSGTLIHLPVINSGSAKEKGVRV